MRTGRKTLNRGPRACFRGSSNAIGNAMEAWLGDSGWRADQQTCQTLQSDTAISKTSPGSFDLDRFECSRSSACPHRFRL